MNNKTRFCRCFLLLVIQLSFALPFQLSVENNYYCQGIDVCCAKLKVSEVSSADKIYYAGFNYKSLKNVFKNIKNWKWYISAEKKVKSLFKIKENKKKSDELSKVIESFNKYSASQIDLLRGSFMDIKSNEDIPKQIVEYLRKAPENTNNTVKTIRCFREKANQVRCELYDGAMLKMNGYLEVTAETIEPMKYDISNMQEFSYTDQLGVEYVCFRIPREPQFLVDPGIQKRIKSQCLYFELPKDKDGKWERFRTLLIDLFTNPMELWDEIKFRRELLKLNIGVRDVMEIEEYLFAKVELKNGYIKSSQKQVA